MARRRKKFDIFSMSFLDTICCAFGAIVLLYMILNAAGNKAFKNETSELRAEVDKLEEEVLQGFADLVVLRNSLKTTTTEAARAEGLSDRVLQETAKTREQLADAGKGALAEDDGRRGIEHEGRHGQIPVSAAQTGGIRQECSALRLFASADFTDAEGVGKPGAG